MFNENSVNKKFEKIFGIGVKAQQRANMGKAQFAPEPKGSYQVYSTEGELIKAEPVVTSVKRRIKHKRASEKVSSPQPVIVIAERELVSTEPVIVSVECLDCPSTITPLGEQVDDEKKVSSPQSIIVEKVRNHHGEGLTDDAVKEKLAKVKAIKEKVERRMNVWNKRPMITSKPLEVNIEEEISPIDIVTGSNVVIPSCNILAVNGTPTRPISWN